MTQTEDNIKLYRYLDTNVCTYSEKPLSVFINIILLRLWFVNFLGIEYFL